MYLYFKEELYGYHREKIVVTEDEVAGTTKNAPIFKIFLNIFRPLFRHTLVVKGKKVCHMPL